jgi:hypothetical protein
MNGHGASLAACLEQLERRGMRTDEVGCAHGRDPAASRLTRQAQVVYDPFDWLLEATQNS